jgi:hypothetical protein
MIRPADMTDMNPVLALARAAHAAGHLADQPFDERTAGSTFIDLIGSRNGVVFVDDEDGIKGFIAGTVAPSFFGPSKSATEIVTLATRPGSGRPLVRAFIDWGLARADEVILANSSGDARVDHLYKRMGLPQMGGLYVIKRMK